MPDLITHTGVGVLLGWKWRSQMARMYPFLIGCVLPDFAVHLPAQAIKRLWNVLEWAPYPQVLLRGLWILHEPVGIFLFCLWLSLFARDLLQTFWGLLGGAMLHYCLDFLQYHPLPGYMPLFPLSLQYMELGWVSTEASLYTAPFWLVLIGVYFWEKRQEVSDGGV